MTDGFLEMLGGIDSSACAGPEVKMPASALQRGMELASDLVSPEGLLLLSKDLLDDSMIGQTRKLEQTEGKPPAIYVQPGRG